MNPRHSSENSSTLELGEIALLLGGITKVDYIENFTDQGRGILVIAGVHGEPASRLAGVPDPE